VDEEKGGKGKVVCSHGLSMEKKIISKSSGANLLNPRNSFGLALFVWFISPTSAILFSQNKSAPATSHQPVEQGVRVIWCEVCELSVNFGISPTNL
jgi:hypothetical protein